MYEKEKREIIKACLQMKVDGLIRCTCGNVSLRMPCGNFLVTPSSMDYETMLPEDIVLVDENCNVVEGTCKPSSDTKAILYVFKHRPDANCVIHTHQPYASAVGLVADVLPANQTAIIDTMKANVPVAPYTISSDEGMGIMTVDYCGDAQGVILAHHGVMAFDKSLERCVKDVTYLEEGAKAYLAAYATGLPMRLLTPEEIQAELTPRAPLVAETK